MQIPSLQLSAVHSNNLKSGHVTDTLFSLSFRTHLLGNAYTKVATVSLTLYFDSLRIVLFSLRLFKIRPSAMGSPRFNLGHPRFTRPRSYQCSS
jgi:hypothetical protein